MTGHERSFKKYETTQVSTSSRPLIFQEDLDLLVDDTWEWIFREQLNGWMRDADLWPEGLTREMFLEWFDCEVSTMIWDMLKSRIKPAL